MPIGARPTVTYWQDWAILVVGVWLFVSPWMLNFVEAPAAAWNAWIFGILIGAFAVASLIQYARWVEWVMAAAGLWVVLAPWLLAFAGAGDTRPVFNHLLVGLIVGALALWNGLAHTGERGVVWE